MYIYNKKYDTSYGDLIPNIIANAIMKNIIIVMKTKGNTRIDLISCLEANQPSILVYKNGAHYDDIRLFRRVIMITCVALLSIRNQLSVQAYYVASIVLMITLF